MGSDTPDPVLIFYIRDRLFEKGEIQTDLGGKAVARSPPDGKRDECSERSIEAAVKRSRLWKITSK